MNIWILNHYAVPQKYYYLARSYNFAKQLITKGHQVTIFAASSVHNSDVNLITDGSLYTEIVEDGIPYVLFRSRQYSGNGKDRVINHIDVAAKMVKHCPGFTEKYGKPDVIFASAGQSLTLVAGISLAKKTGVKCVSEVTDLWPESFVAYDLISKKNPLLKLLYFGEKWIYKKSDALIFSMEGGKDYIIEKGWDTAHGGPVDLDKVYHINNGVDLEVFSMNSKKNDYHDVDLDNHELFKVVYTGSIRLANQIEKLVDVAEYLQMHNFDRIKLLLWGAGDQVDVINQDINRRGLKNIILKGSVPKTTVPQILKKSDLNIYLLGDSPLYRFGLSLNKSFEYFASGKPVLANHDSGYSIIDRYRCGVCLEEFTAENMAKEIISFYEMPKEEYQRYCDNAKRAAEDYDFKRLTYKLISILEK